MQKLLTNVLRRAKCDDLGVDIPLLGFSSLGDCRRRLSNHALSGMTSSNSKTQHNNPTKRALHADMSAAGTLKYSEGI